jgi:hypothetical protein
MRYPNAYTGVSQIYKAELIAILAAVCTGIGAILAIFGVGVADVGSEAVGTGIAITGGLFVIATVVLMIVSYILNIIGVGNAAKDESGFRSAMIAIIIGIVASIVAGIFSNKEVVCLLAQLVSKICDIMVFWFCIGGIRNLADKMNDRNIANKADSFTKLIIGIYVAGIVLAIIGSFVKVGGFLDGFIDVAGAVCSIVAYLSYLSLLKGAREMLAR